MRAKMQQASKPKKSSWRLLSRDDWPKEYAFLDEQLRHHEDLEGASIKLVWMIGKTPDKDGHLVLGKCVRAPELWQKASSIDFVIGLNQDFWHEANDGQKSYLIDHELCHAAQAIDEETGDQKIDDQGFLQWRTKKHDLEEFFEPVQRHGLRMSSLHRFYQIAHKAQQTLPFSWDGADVEAAVEGLRPKEGSEIESVTISSGGESVTLRQPGKSADEEPIEAPPLDANQYGELWRDESINLKKISMDYIRSMAEEATGSDPGAWSKRKRRGCTRAILKARDSQG